MDEELYKYEFSFAKKDLHSTYGVEELTNIEGFYLSSLVQSFVNRIDELNKDNGYNNFDISEEAVARWWFGLYDYNVTLEENFIYNVFEINKPTKNSGGKLIKIFKSYEEARDFVGQFGGKVKKSLPRETKEYLQKIREESYLL